MPRKLLVVCATFLLVAALVFAAGRAVEPGSGVHVLDGAALCPVAGCAGECHGYADVPQPDGLHEMTCPEAGCASAECHAWDTLQDRYHQASDASLNLWVLAPVALVVSLVALVGALSRPGRGAAGGGCADGGPDGRGGPGRAPEAAAGDGEGVGAR